MESQAIGNTVHGHLISVRHHLTTIQALLERHQFVHNPWMVQSKPLMGHIIDYLDNRETGLNNWPIMLWVQQAVVETVILRNRVAMLLERLEVLRAAAAPYHPESCNMQWTLCQPVYAELDFAIGYLRKAWCLLNVLIEEKRVYNFTVPPPDMANGC